MQLELPQPPDRYKSASHRARVATELWAAYNLYCPNCESYRVRPTPPNTPAIDYFCARCAEPFQLKSQSRPFATRITDAAYEPMRKAILENRTPNLFALHYDLSSWSVRQLILIPRFVFSLSLLEKRKPLAPTARRAGWVGCNILLRNVPLDAQIVFVWRGQMTSHKEVRRKYAGLKPLAGLSVEKRGWTLDVLNAIRSLDKLEFSLADVYACERDLGRLHPDNRHIRDKIRQQLQVLRDLGFLEFLGGGRYRLV